MRGDQSREVLEVKYRSWEQRHVHVHVQHSQYVKYVSVQNVQIKYVHVQNVQVQYVQYVHVFWCQQFSSH